MKLILNLLAFPIILTAPSTFAQLHLTDIGSPPELDGVEGNSYAGIFGGISPSRFQQVYATSDFLSSFPQGGYIYQIAFRTDGPTGVSFGVVLPDVQVIFSTTSRSPDGLSPVFNQNLGADAMVAFSGLTSLQATHNTPPGTPEAIGAGILLTTPFYYNPAMGNLLMDIRSSGGPVTSSFDASSTAGDSVSSVFAYNNGLLSGTPSTTGAWTFFAILPVPEPGTWALGGLGIGFVTLTLL